MRRGYIILSLLVCWSCALSNDMDPEVVFKEANALYEEGKLEEAAQLYEQIAAVYGSQEVEFNLGNTYYRIDEIAQSILHYERALRYAPQNEDVLYNLERARLQTVDKIETADTDRFSAWWSANLLQVGADSWARISVFFGFILMMCAGAYFFLSSRSLRRLGLNLALVSFVLCLVTLGFSLSAKSTQLAVSEAIIMSPKVEIQSSPSESSTELLILHQGTKVDILRESNEWSEVRLTNGHVGWMKTTDLALI